jgi:hypothetical protein
LVRPSWVFTYRVKVPYRFSQIMNSIRTVSRKQGHFRESVSGGSWSAKPGAHVQECDRRLSSRDELANDNDVQWERNRVNHRVVRGKLISLSGEICLQGGQMLIKTENPVGYRTNKSGHFRG